jgi:LAS superfamily LD-carboxypeptidase LdcB
VLRLTLLVLVTALAAALGHELSAAPSATPNVLAAPPERPRAHGGLAPALDDALRRARADAPFELVVTSGRRSREHQQQLFDEAVAKYGSEAEAARWVARPETSAHVSGDAVDIGPPAGAAWLAEHGAEYGLCPVYRNEPWHFELRAETRAFGCPELYEDPTHDPRLQ